MTRNLIARLRPRRVIVGYEVGEYGLLDGMHK